VRIVVTSPNWTLNGVNAFNATLVRGLRARGHDVTLLLTGSMWRDDKPLPIPDDLAVSHLALPSVATWPARWTALQRSLEAAAPCLYLPNHDIAHSGISPALSSRVGILGIAHSDDPQHYDHARRLARWWNGVVGVSETIVRALGAMDEVRATPVTHIPYGVAVSARSDVASRARQRSAPGEPLRIVYAGRLEDRQKRVSDLIAIASALRARAVSFELTIAGDGPARGHLATAVREARLDDVVRLVGTVPMDQMAELYRAHQVFLLPSAFEGLPLALLESMGQGCVPLVSDIASGVPELVRDGEIGYRVAVGDVDAFAERLALLSREADLCAKMSSRAWEAVARGPYGIDEMVYRYERLLGDIWSEVTSGRYARRAADIVPPPGLDWRALLRAPLAALRDRPRGSA